MEFPATAADLEAAQRQLAAARYGVPAAPVAVAAVFACFGRGGLGPGATGDWPVGSDRGARTPLWLAGEVVGYWVRTRRDCRPLAVHAAWRTDAETAAAVVVGTLHRARTPEPLRQARRLARIARTQHP